MRETDPAACERNDSLPDGNTLPSVDRAGSGTDHISSPASKKTVSQSFGGIGSDGIFLLRPVRKENIHLCNSAVSSAGIVLASIGYFMRNILLVRAHP